MIDRLTAWQFLTPLKKGKLLAVVGEGFTDDIVSKALPPNMSVVKLYFTEKKIGEKEDFPNIDLPDNSVGKAIIFGKPNTVNRNKFFEELHRVLCAGAGVCFFVSKRIHAFSLKKFLKSHDFVSVRIYGIFPSFNYPRWIIPLRTKYFISSTKGIFKPVKLVKKICWKIIVPFSYFGLHYLIARNYIMISVKGEETRNEEKKDLLALLYDLLGKEKFELSLLNRPKKYYQKTNAQVMNLDGDIVAYVKIGDTPQVKALLDNEYKILEILKQLDIQTVRFPHVIYFGETDQAKFMVQRAELSLREGPIYLSKEHILFLTEIFRKTARIYDFEGSPLLINMRESLKGLEDYIEKKWQNLLKLTLERIYQRFKGKKIHLGLAHLDFAAWNTCLNDKGQLVIFDWELASFEETPLVDFYNFAVNTEGMIGSKKGDEILSLLIDKKSFYFELMNQYKKAFGTDIFFDYVGFLHVYLYKASVFALNLQKLQKQVHFTEIRLIRLLSILRIMLDEVLKLS